jgi:Protein of unknown function (DUF3987)
MSTPREKVEGLMANGFRVQPQTQSGASDSKTHLWPTLPEKALPGIVGDIVRAACDTSEADPAAVLGSVLVWFGASFGAQPHVMVGDTRHFSRLFCFKVGASARARKGTSEDPVKRVFRAAEQLDPADGVVCVPLEVSPGPLSTGEGLVRAVRDPSEDKDDDGTPIDPGVSDKRLLVIEAELGAPLRAAQREGNTLSAILRMAWDSGDIAPLTKSNRIKTSGAHVSIIGHITGEELKQVLRSSDVWNGFANRVLWFCVKRAKRVPFPEPMPPATIESLARSVRDILDKSGEVDRIEWSPQAKEQWKAMYEEISADDPGTFGAVTARAEAQVQRLAMIYALIDGSHTIQLEHFLSALAVWEYAKASAKVIFEGVSEDPDRIKLLDFLRGGSRTQTEINGRFGGHLKAANLTALLKDLQALGEIDSEQRRTSGRSITVWFIKSRGAEDAEKAEEDLNGQAYSASSALSAISEAAS